MLLSRLHQHLAPTIPILPQSKRRIQSLARKPEEQREMPSCEVWLHTLTFQKAKGMKDAVLKSSMSA